jgi:NTE family protein
LAKRALVISGGGSKGAYAVGVIKSLMEAVPAVPFDIFIGTSTGALIVPFAASGDIDKLIQFYTSVTTDNIVSHGNLGERVLSEDSLLDAVPLANLIKQNYNDAFLNALLASPKSVFIVTTCLQTGSTTYFSSKDQPATEDGEVVKIANPDIFRRAIMASACQPVFMPPIEMVPGAMPSRQYVDGGVRVYAGIQLAIDAGADEIYAVLLTPAKEDPLLTTYLNVFPILERTIDIFTTNVAINGLRLPMLFSKGLQYIEEVKKAMLAGGISQADIDRFFGVASDNPFSGRAPATIYVIRPDEDLGGGTGGLNFVPADMRAILAQGESQTDQFLVNLPRGGSNMV